MTNPEIARGKTPNGGDFSELWYLTKDGEAATNKSEAANVRILEKTDSGEIVGETYGTIQR